MHGTRVPLGIFHRLAGILHAAPLVDSKTIGCDTCHAISHDQPSSAFIVRLASQNVDLWIVATVIRLHRDASLSLVERIHLLTSQGSRLTTSV